MLRWLKNFIYSIPFGMKGAEDEMLSQKSSPNTDTQGTHETVRENRLSKDLLKGEVTEQVEELRYRDYTVSKEARKYKYVGDGEAVRKDSEERDITDFEFTQPNKMVCESVNDELHRVGQYGTERYTLSISYVDIPKFKLESYATRAECKIKGNTASLSVFFEPYGNKYNITTKAFLNELKRLCDGNQRYMLNNHEFCTNVKKVVFTTYKAYNEDDFILYSFNELKCVRAERLEKEFVLEYTTSNFTRTDLTEKFESESMKRKYANHEPKENNTFYFQGSEREEYCSDCGKRINVYDADLTREEFGVPLCVECVEKKILEKS
jgi:hypothetical protein